jgi:hypothetical protein
MPVCRCPALYRGRPRMEHPHRATTLAVNCASGTRPGADSGRLRRHRGVHRRDRERPCAVTHRWRRLGPATAHSRDSADPGVEERRLPRARPLPAACIRSAVVAHTSASRFPRCARRHTSETTQLSTRMALHKILVVSPEDSGFIIAWTYCATACDSGCCPMRRDLSWRQGAGAWLSAPAASLPVGKEVSKRLPSVYL